jgi:hypothetical protein
MYSNAGASNGTLTRLPSHQRKWALQYANDDGTTAATAFPVNYDELYNLKGRLLTLVDATFTDPEQRKAQKDMVWQTLRSWMDDIERAGMWQAEPGIAQPEPAVG